MKLVLFLAAWTSVVQITASPRTIKMIPELQASGFVETSYMKKAADAAKSVVSALLEAGSFGAEVWEKLSANQGRETLKDLETSTTTLKVQNDTLLKELEASRQDHSEPKVEIAARMVPLNNGIKVILTDVEKFSVEIDNTLSHASTTREEIASAGAQKPIALRRVETEWQTGHYDEAIGSLKEGIRALEEMLIATRCLEDSIDARKPVCDSSGKRFPH